MATITGIFEGLIVVKEGQGKRGSWKLYSIKVDGKKYGIGFNPVKAATGERVVFETQTNDNGYEDADPKTFKVIGPATAESSAAASQAGDGSGATSESPAKQRSIEIQSSISAAASIVVAKIMSGAQIDAASEVESLVSRFLRILHPAPKPAPPPKRVEPEDENQDEFGDDLPY